MCTRERQGYLFILYSIQQGTVSIEASPKQQDAIFTSQTAQQAGIGNNRGCLTLSRLQDQRTRSCRTPETSIFALHPCGNNGHSRRLPSRSLLLSRQRSSLLAISLDKAKYGANNAANSVGDARTKVNKLAPEGGALGAPALVSGQEASDSLDELRKRLGSEGELDAQFDDDGNLDLATIQRMLDILYKPAREGVKGAAHAAGKVLEVAMEDDVDVDAADAAEVADESGP